MRISRGIESAIKLHIQKRDGGINTQKKAPMETTVATLFKKYNMRK
ncbi:hypothetical protein [Flexithrix dorotheae]|nr:hypothetical protein [Flexithrix dorotheae]